MKKYALAAMNIARKVSYLYLANTVTSVSGFVIVLLLANTLEQSDYGYYKYVFSFVGTLSVLSLTGGFRNTTLQSVAKGFDGVVLHLFKRTLPLSIPMLIGAGVACLWYVSQGNTVIGYSILLVTLFSILGNWGVIAYGYLNGRKLYKSLFVLQSLQGITLVVVLALILLFTKSAFPIIVASAAITGLTFTCFFFYIRSLTRNTEISPLIHRFGTHLSIMSMISTVMINIDSILIFKVIGAEALALYALATPFVDRFIGFLKATYYYVLPRFTESGPEQAYPKLYKRSFYALGVGILVNIAYYFIAPVLFSIFFPKYMESIELTRLFALTIPIIAFTILLDAFLDSLIEAKRKYIVKISVTSVRLITLMLLIYPFGITGVIWSEIIARLCGTAITIVLIEHKMRSYKKTAHP